jgi:hypothetical protein
MLMMGGAGFHLVTSDATIKVTLTVGVVGAAAINTSSV